MNRFLDRILVNPRGLIGGVTTPKYHFTSRNDHTRKMFSSQSCDVFMFVTENEPCSIVSSLSHVDHISIENFFLLKPLFILCLLLFIIVVLYVNNWEGKSKGARSRGFPGRDEPSTGWVRPGICMHCKRFLKYNQIEDQEGTRG